MALIINGDNLAAGWRGLDRLPLLRQAGLLVGIALALALGVAVVMWSQEPNYRVLDPHLPDRYKVQLMDALQSAGIDYRLERGTGAVMVPAAELYRARLQLANSGIPQTTEKGYELLEQDPGFGASQRLETARIQRALEGELTRSIRGLRSVEQARVHLALPERSVFVRDRTPASASVVVKLYPGRRLDEARIAGIQELVASSVPELLPEDVAVLDDQGRLLSAAKGGAAAIMSGKRLAMTRELEKTYVERIEQLLEPMFGPLGIRAQVTIDLDYSQVETTNENFDPDNTARPLVRSEQIVENNIADELAGGVPGALSNQPPPDATIEAPGATATEAGTGADSDGTATTAADAGQNREVTRNYELSRRIEHIKSEPGRIRRLSVAVLVDNVVTPATGTDTQPETLTDEQLANIEALVREAVGFNTERGDSIRVSAVDFKQLQATPEPLPAAPFWEQAWLWDIAKQVLGAILLVTLLFAVLRPTLKTLAHPAGGVLPEAGQLALPPSEPRLGLPAPGIDQQQLESRQDQLSYARSIAASDPKRVAQVTRTWLNGDE